MTAPPVISTPMRNRLRDAAHFGRLPTLPTERDEAWGDVLLMGLNDAIAPWGLLIGGYEAALLGAGSDSALTLLAGLVMGVALATIAALGCHRFGVDAVDLSKSYLGQRGASALLALFFLSQVGWAGLMLVMFGRSVHSILISLGISRGDDVVSLMVLMGMATAYVSVARDIRGLSALYRFTTPCMAVIVGIVIYGVLRDAAWQDLVRIPPLAPGPDTRLNHVAAFECALGVGFSWWPVVARIHRSAESLRAAIYPQVVSLGIVLGGVVLAGQMGALLFRHNDPTQWLVFLGGRAFGALTLSAVAMSNLVACINMMRTTGSALRHFGGLRRVTWPWLAVIPFIPLLIFVVVPMRIYEHGAMFISCNALVLAPLCAVNLVDYYVLRRQQLNVSQLYENATTGHFWFIGGVNWAAWICAGVGIVCSAWLYNPFSQNYHGLARWMGASGPAMVISAACYWSVARIARGSGLGGYEATTRAQPLSRSNI